MDSLKRVLKYQSIDVKASFAWFWGIMLLIDILSYILNIYLSSAFGEVRIGVHLNDGVLNVFSIAGANLWIITIFLFVYSYTMFYESFPIAISFSVTRKDFYKSIILNNIKVVFLFSVIQSVLMKLDRYVISSLNKSPMVDFKIVNTETDNILIMIVSLFIVFLTMTSIFNFLAALNYKFGWKIWIVLGIIYFTTIIFMGSTFLSILDWILTTRVNIAQILTLILLTALMYGIGGFLSRSINIKSKIG